MSCMKFFFKNATYKIYQKNDTYEKYQKNITYGKYYVKITKITMVINRGIQITYSEII